MFDKIGNLLSYNVETKMNKAQEIILILPPFLYYFLTLFLWPPLIILCVIFTIYRKILNLILEKKIGPNYGGLLDVADSVFLIKDARPNNIVGILLIKSETKRDIFQNIKEKVVTKIFNCPNQYSKLTSTQHEFGGYPYWINNDYKVEDCVTLMSIPQNKEFNEDCFKEIIGNIYSEPFPKNGLWDLKVSPIPLENYKKDGFYYYPVLTKFSHAICDGTSLFALLISVFGGENNSNKIFEKLFKRKPKTTNKTLSIKYLVVNLKKLGMFLNSVFYVMFIGLGKVIKTTHLTPHDQNALHGPDPCRQKLAAWYVEEDVTYVPMVKRIKDRVEDVTFSHVVMTAISASLTDYFKRNSHPIPEATSTIFTTLLRFPTIDNSKPASLENKATLLISELPTNKSGSLIKTLKTVKAKLAEVKYEDALVNTFILSKVAGTFPLTIASKLLGPGLCTNLVSNIPGGSKVTVLDGCVMEKVISFAPNAKKVGISIALLTYDNKFQVGILVDKSILSSQKEVQRIADDILSNIRLMDKETEKYTKTKTK